MRLGIAHHFGWAVAVTASADHTGRGPPADRADRTRYAGRTDPPPRQAARRRRDRGAGGAGASVGGSSDVRRAGRARGRAARTDRLDVAAGLADRLPPGHRRPAARAVRGPRRLGHVPPGAGRARPRARLGRPPLRRQGRRGPSGQQAGRASRRDPARAAGSDRSALGKGPPDGARRDDRGRRGRQPGAEPAFLPPACSACMSSVADPPADAVDAPPPCPPRPSNASDLGFVRRPMVRWFDPHQLIDTAVRVLLSGVFSSYADSRERRRESRPRCRIAPVSPSCGSTTSPISATAGTRPTPWPGCWRPKRSTLDWDGETHRTERGRLLVFGGDAVYPVPKAARVREPDARSVPVGAAVRPRERRLSCSRFRAATTGTTGWSTSPASSVATAGSADGGRASGAATSRSSCPTAGGCGASTSSSAPPIDEVQLRYFADVAADQMQPGDRVILCMSKEVESGRKEARGPLRPRCGVPRARDHPAQRRPAAAVPQERQALLLALRGAGRPPPSHRVRRRRRVPASHPQPPRARRPARRPTDPPPTAEPAPIRQRRSPRGCGSGSG